MFKKTFFHGICIIFSVIWNQQSKETSNLKYVNYSLNLEDNILIWKEMQYSIVDSEDKFVFIIIIVFYNDNYSLHCRTM